jgi:DNA (cytosine-5)-methyltransferase 1
MVAHLSKDGLMFIHPTQNRSLTQREAARVQTFRD